MAVLRSGENVDSISVGRRLVRETGDGMLPEFGEETHHSSVADLQRNGTDVTGSVTVGVLGQPAEILITEGEATYERLYILAEGNALRTIPVTFYSIEIEAVPGEILSGEMTINDQRFDFLAQKN